MSVLSILNPFFTHLSPTTPHFRAIHIHHSLESSRERERGRFLELLHPPTRLEPQITSSFTIHRLPPSSSSVELGGELGFWRDDVYTSSTPRYSYFKVEH
ncbi:hypothetical protein LguiA_033158 [Lonicera macranthoides]